METLNVGIIGTGNIAPAYIRGCAPFEVIKIAACADILVDRAQAFAAEHGMDAHSVDDLLARDDIDIVINLTFPGCPCRRLTANHRSGQAYLQRKTAGAQPC